VALLRQCPVFAADVALAMAKRLNWMDKSYCSDWKESRCQFHEHQSDEERMQCEMNTQKQKSNDKKNQSAK